MICLPQYCISSVRSPVNCPSFKRTFERDGVRLLGALRTGMGAWPCHQCSGFPKSASLLQTEYSESSKRSRKLLTVRYRASFTWLLYLMQGGDVGPTRGSSQTNRSRARSQTMQTVRAPRTAESRRVMGQETCRESSGQT